MQRVFGELTQLVAHIYLAIVGESFTNNTVLLPFCGLRRLNSDVAMNVIDLKGSFAVLSAIFWVISEDCVRIFSVQYSLCHHRFCCLIWVRQEEDKQLAGTCRLYIKGVCRFIVSEFCILFFFMILNNKLYVQCAEHFMILIYVYFQGFLC